ncbi:50S ribosomal protein L19e [Natronorubrum tibetense]|uniref:Large ribosomal subunit protein eL19 n=1 Tax=Natronorubrum tibetense GA33 TaxID=1114856 RepID=L9W8R8_9EURY|nr:50S ribosomal protein L19e [Natronorubrum tibetense]ELY45880.1 50S ribosomal protein L19e [Natronorubrum tibetense GA33]
MTDLSAQKRLAADVLDVGQNRVWLDPDAQSEIAEAITRDEIRDLVDEGRIQADDASGNSRGRARERNKKRAYGHQKGPGKRRGKKGARQNEKDQWQNKIRAQRRKLRELRDSGELTPTQYRQLYKKAGGGEFRSVQYLLNYIDETYGDQ